MPVLFETPTAECLMYDRAIENAMPVIARLAMREEDYLAQPSYWGIHQGVRRAESMGNTSFFVYVAAPTEDRLKILVRLAENVRVDGLWRLKSRLPRTEIVERLNQRLRELDSIRWGIRVDTHQNLSRTLNRWSKSIGLGRCGIQTIIEALGEVQNDVGGAVRANARELQERIETATAGEPLPSFYAGLSTERPYGMEGAHAQMWCRRMHPMREFNTSSKVPSSERHIVFEQGVTFRHRTWTQSKDTRYVLWIDRKTPPENFGVNLLAACVRREQLVAKDGQ